MNRFNNRYEKRTGVFNTNETEETVASNLKALDRFIKKETPTVPDFPNQGDRFDQAIFAEFTVQVHTLFTLGSANGTGRFGRQANDTFESYAEVKEALVATANALKEDENVSKFGFYSRDEALEILKKAQDKYDQSVQDRMQIIESDFWPVLQFSLAPYCKDLKLPKIESALKIPDLNTEKVTPESAATFLQAQYLFFDVIRQQLIVLFEEVPNFQEFTSKKVSEILSFLNSFLVILWQFSSSGRSRISSMSTLKQAEKRHLAVGTLFVSGDESLTVNQDTIPLRAVSKHIENCLVAVIILKNELQKLLSGHVGDTLFFVTNETDFLSDSKVSELLQKADSSQELSQRLVALITAELERTAEVQFPFELLPKLLEDDEARTVVTRLAFPNSVPERTSHELPPNQVGAILTDLESALEDWAVNVSPSTLTTAFIKIQRLRTQLQRVSSLLESLNSNNFIPDEQQASLTKTVKQKLAALNAEEERLQFCQKVYDSLTRPLSPQVQLWKQALDS